MRVILFSQTRTHSSGLSAIEAIVATAVFAVALSGIVGSFLSIMRLDSKSRAVRQVEQQARFISEFLTREIRNGSIYYGPPGGYGGTIPNSGKTSQLHLINRDGVIESIVLSGNQIMLYKSGNTSLLGSDVSVNNFNFYIQPTTAGNQALVTFTFELSSRNNLRPGEQVKLTVQSSVATRNY